MKIVGNLESEVNVPFRVWRKYAYFQKICYESWEEGKVVLLDGDKHKDEEVIADLK